MILIINLCKEKLHFFEFVKPIVDIVKKENKRFRVKSYKEIKKQDLKESSHLIICGTSLKDFNYLKNLQDFSWIKSYNKKILGICSGMLLIGLLYECKLKKLTRIGLKKVNLRIFGTNILYAYFLHNFSLKNYKNFEKINKGKDLIAFKHKNKDFYGVMFHPEVRNKELIINFLK